MAGVRLHHPTFFSCNYVVELEAAYPEPYDCPACKITHQRKSIHLRLDEHGDVIVAKGIFEQLQKAVGMAGLEVANEVTSPPPMFVGAVDLNKTEIRPFTVNGTDSGSFYVPGRSKWESRDIMVKPFQPLLDKMAEAMDRKRTAELAQKRSIHILNGGSN